MATKAKGKKNGVLLELVLVLLSLINKPWRLQGPP
jgi:hypothetical protein